MRCRRAPGVEPDRRSGLQGFVPSLPSRRAAADPSLGSEIRPGTSARCSAREPIRDRMAGCDACEVDGFDFHVHAMDRCGVGEPLLEITEVRAEGYGTRAFFRAFPAKLDQALPRCNQVTLRSGPALAAPTLRSLAFVTGRCRILGPTRQRDEAGWPLNRRGAVNEGYRRTRRFNRGVRPGSRSTPARGTHVRRRPPIPGALQVAPPARPAAVRSAGRRRWHRRR